MVNNTHNALTQLRGSLYSVLQYVRALSVNRAQDWSAERVAAAQVEVAEVAATFGVGNSHEVMTEWTLAVTVDAQVALVCTRTQTRSPYVQVKSTDGSFEMFHVMETLRATLGPIDWDRVIPVS